MEVPVQMSQYDARLEHTLKVRMFEYYANLRDQGLLSMEEAKAAYERNLEGGSLFPDTIEGEVALQGLFRIA